MSMSFSNIRRSMAYSIQYQVINQICQVRAQVRQKISRRKMTVMLIYDYLLTTETILIP